MGIFDRLRSAVQPAEDSQKTPGTSEQSATSLIEKGHVLEAERKLDEAIQCYLDAIRVAPNPARAHLNLGNALLLKGDLQGALDAFRTAIKHKPDYAGAHYNIGNALLGNKQFEGAAASHRQALEINPDYAEAHCALGITLQKLGQFEGAVECFKKALEINPDLAEAHSSLGNILIAFYNQGNVLAGNGQKKDAVEIYRQVLEIEPNFAEAHCNLGLVLQELGQLEDAEASLAHALEIKPDLVEAHYNLGITLLALGRSEDAAASFRQTLEIQPDYAGAHANLGLALQNIGQLKNAESSYRQALELDPSSAEAHNNLGIALQSLEKHDEAVTSCLHALELNPNLAEAHNNLGISLSALGQSENAMKCFNNALGINPDYADAHSNLGMTLQNLGKHDDAIVSFRRALEIKPDHSETFSNLLFCLSHSESVNTQTQFAEHRRFAEQFETHLRASWPQHSHSQDPERHLKIGFVSGDLYNHAVAHFFEPVLSHLASYPQLSLHAYYNHTVEDNVTNRLQEYCASWNSIVGLSDQALAQKIREDGIDILYDLSGHTGRNRLLTFARKPAPIQVSWIGYPGTTGLSAMDYYQSDRFMFPDDRFDTQFTEKIVRLPASSAFLPSEYAPPVNALPALTNGHITFGSFNRTAKINRSSIALWSQLLHALPNAKMLLGAMPHDGKYQTATEWFAEEGIEQDRFILHARGNMLQYLELHHQIDICLDTLPYNGGTTTFHALWMGVPTLTVSGHTMAGYVGTSILGHAGLNEEFSAKDSDDFVQKGLFWSDNLTSLSNIRAELRDRFAKSARGQPAVVAASMERALRIMWQRWCEGLPAESFEVQWPDVDRTIPKANDSSH